MALWNSPAFQSKDTIRPVKDPVTGIIQRTNTSLEVSDGDAPAQKWLVDSRLPVLFTYGFATGINQMVMSKGLIVAADPERFQKDFETGKMHSVLTIANGGKDVVLDTDKIHWKAKTDETTGIRLANTPIGVVNANVMKKVDDQLSGMAPTVVTRKYIKLPLFDNSTHAYANPWGSAYGTFKPGDYVKSDLNGRFIKWDGFAKATTEKAITPGAGVTTGTVDIGKVAPGTAVVVAALDPAVGTITEGLVPVLDYELGTIAVSGLTAEVENGFAVTYFTSDDEAQKVGQILAVQNYLVPEGAAIWASWALEDKLNTEYYNPEETMPESQGEYPGYPYDKAYGYNELKRPDPRMPMQYELGKGIPGLTDGYNVTKTTITGQVVDEVPVGTFTELQNRYMKTKDVNVESLQVAVKASYGATVRTTAYADIADLTAENAVVFKNEANNADVNLGHIDFADVKTGLIVLAVDTPASLATANLTKVEILVKYVKRGQAGVPTMLDWDGCTGEVRVLLQK